MNTIIISIISESNPITGVYSVSEQKIFNVQSWYLAHDFLVVINIQNMEEVETVIYSKCSVKEINN